MATLRVQPELAAQGFVAGRDRIARLRRELGLRCNDSVAKLWNLSNIIKGYVNNWDLFPNISQVYYGFIITLWTGGFYES